MLLAKILVFLYLSILSNAMALLMGRTAFVGSRVILAE